MRLIDADALAKDIETFNRPLCDDYHMKGYVLDQIITDIKNAPTVEAVPVVHGRWVYQHTGIDGESEYICSNCLVTVGYEYQYCPYCGAKMDEVTYDSD